MEQYQQHLIQTNYSTLVKEMKAIPVAGYIINEHILTDELQQQIQFEKTTYSRKRKILNLISFGSCHFEDRTQNSIWT